MNAGCSAVMADANSGGYVKQVNIAICTQIGVPPKPPASSRRTWAGWGIAIPGSSHRRQAFIQLGRDVLGDTSYSFGRAHVHLNLVDMTAPCAAKRPVLEAHARRCSAQNFRTRLAHRAADLRDGGRQYRFFNL